MTHGLTFIIHPENESVSIGLFVKVIEDVSRLIRDVDYAVTKEQGKRRWIISELRSSAPTITLRPSIDNAEIIEALVHGLYTVSKGTLEPPPYFSEQVLDDLIRMRHLFFGQDKAKRLLFSSNGAEPAVIEKDIGQKAERILKGGYWNLGSLEGTLEAINLQGVPTFTIWDRVSRAPVRCYFPKEHEWKVKVKGFLEKRVLVIGRVNYFRNGVPRSITNIQRLEDTTPDPRLQRATFGSIPTPDAAKDPTRFLRVLRDGRR